MRSRTFNHPTRDMALLGGWLFADLFLGLMVVFLAAVPPVPKAILPPPVLQISAQTLRSNDGNCTGGIGAPSCQLTLSETTSSQGSVNWAASSDMSDRVAFHPSQGTLSPGQSIQITLSAFPCQNGSFTFSGSRGAVPVSVDWLCTPPPPPQERLDFVYKSFSITLQSQDINGLLSDTQVAQNDVKQLIQNALTSSRNANRIAGLAIVYGGAPDTPSIAEAQNIADKVYNVLKNLGSSNFVFERSSYYQPLYVLGNDPSIVNIDIYFFQ
jgi:hypothetical protein